MKLQDEQNDFQIDEIVEPTLGFKCGEGGNYPSHFVAQFDTLIRSENYNEIRNRISSSIPTEIFLATFICQKLHESKEIELTKRELRQISENEDRWDLVHCCSGCTFNQPYMLKELLTEANNPIREEAEEWFETLKK